VTLHPEWLDWPETQTLMKAFAGKGELRFVGGAVRDAILGRAVTDVDAATTLVPEKTMKTLQAANIKAVPTGIDHGTVTAVIGDKPFEITTLRKDTSTDGRWAEVAYTTDWQEDTKRRDFTMNALYLSPEGELFDYHGGEQDAKAGRVRFIGDAESRIKEDYLRILRLFRFHAHYGKEPIDEATLQICGRMAPNIEKLSGERIQNEMQKLLNAPLPAATLKTMQQCEVLKQVMGFDPDLGIIAKLESADALLRLAALVGYPNLLADLANRWKLSDNARDALKEWLENSKEIHAGLSLSEQKHYLRVWGKENFRYAVLLRAAMNGGNYAPLLKLADSWDIPQLPVTGKDIVALGIPEGKEVGEKLRALEVLWEESDYTLTREALLKRLA
jgi:poly(A) polymerase